MPAQQKFTARFGALPRSALSMRTAGQIESVDHFFGKLTRFSIIGLFIIALAAGLYAGQYVLAPVIAAILVGFTLRPLSIWIERRGLPSSVSAGLIVVALIAVMGVAVYSLAVPLESWSSRLPEISTRLMDEWSKLSEPIEKIKKVEKTVKQATDDETTTEVRIKQRGVVSDIISSAADIVSRLILFVGCLYFFLATRTSLNRSVLRSSPTPKLRLRSLRILRDIEGFLSKYFASIAAINVGFGIVVGIAMYLLGLPQPYLWGAMAAVLNFALFVGPAAMTIILLGVGISTFPDTVQAVAPALTYVGLNMLEGQFVTPTLLGERLTLNPLVVLISIAFWLWLWGPIGAFLAVPILIMGTIIFYHVSPFSDLPANSKDSSDDETKKAA